MVKEGTSLLMIAFTRGSGSLMRFKEMYAKQGTLKWPDGSVYIGQFYRGKRHGEGRMIYGPGYNSVFYEGGYKNDLKDGFGVLTTKEGFYRG